jgi:phosphoglycolate phosphatase
MMNRMLKLILFDLDGTLVDSSQDITNALNYSISPLGLGPLTTEETLTLVGEGITRLIEKVLDPDRVDRKDEVLERFLEYYTLHLTDYTRPYPEVRETLAVLNGYIKGVISNKREILTKQLLEKLHMASYFRYILGSDSTPQRKPSPLPIITVLKETGVNPGEAMMVGDSGLDIEAGNKAGVVTVGVGYGFRPLKTLEGADYLLTGRFSEILDIIEEVGK